MNDAAQLRAAQIKRLAGLANVVSALLCTVDSMYPEQQVGALAMCADLADSMTSDLEALVRGDA